MFNQKIDMRNFTTENYRKTLQLFFEYVTGHNKTHAKQYVLIKNSSETPFDRLKQNIHQKN